MITDIDADGSGSIEFPEFLEMMTGKMGEKDTNEEINKVFKLFDDDSTGKISFKNLKRRQGARREHDRGGAAGHDRPGRPRWRWRDQPRRVLPHHEEARRQPAR